MTIKNKLLVPLIVVSIIGLATTGSLTGVILYRQSNSANSSEDLLQLQEDLQELQEDFQELMADYAIIVGENEELEEQITQLMNDYNGLLVLYSQLEANLNGIITMVKTLPYLDKMSFYYHWTRMDFFKLGYYNSLTYREYLIEHACYLENHFGNVDSILEKYSFFETGSSMGDAWDSLNALGSWLSYWTSGHYEENIFDWVINNLEYRYDSETSYGRNYNFDLLLSPVETLKYRAGDCDDFATLGGAMLINNGYEVAYATIHDNVYYPGGLNHAFLFVNVGESRILSKLPITNPNMMWRMYDSADHDWLIFDFTPGWQNDPWHKPGWLQWYDLNGVVWSDWFQYVTRELID